MNNINNDIISKLEEAKRLLSSDSKALKEQAFSLYYETARDGEDENAGFRLAKCYHDGVGVERDEEKALEYFIEHANKGNAEAAYKVYYLYRFIRKDGDKAKEWAKKAHELGHVEGTYWYASLITDEDPTTAFKLYYEAAERGLTLAQRTIAEIYSGDTRSFPVSKDYQKAFEWYSKAASLDDPNACERLGYYYSAGKGVRESTIHSNIWYKKSFDIYMKKYLDGETIYAYDIAMFYRGGRGMPKDIEKAKQWEDLAFSSGKKEYTTKFFQELLDDVYKAIDDYKNGKITPKIESLYASQETYSGEIISTGIKYFEPGQAISLSKIVAVISKIKSHCNEIDALRASVDMDYNNEQTIINKKSSEIKNDMKTRFDEFKYRYFGSIKDDANLLINILSPDYKNELDGTQVNDEYRNLSFEENEAKLHALIGELNSYIEQLNNVNYNKLVPPVKYEVKGESFVSYTGNRENLKQFNCDSKKMEKVNDPKPIKDLAKQVFPCCKKIVLCVEALTRLYEQSFKINEFESYVNSSAKAWLAETKARLESKYDKRFDELFRNEQAEAIPKAFFAQLEADEKASNVDLYAGTTEYNDSITIGKMKLLVDTKKEHLDYFKDSPVLSQHLENGYLPAPLILDLKKCGNIMLNVNEDSYSDETIHFVNQLIMQFLVSFPANRINFCLLDIDNKMGFSQFKTLTKINNNILFNGIIRDDRQFDNTIKDMEQTMYRIDDDILSYNNVEDIYEYNTKFEANPQNVHLFVLVNYPSGMRDDISKRVLKIIQNGNKAGIFSIVINNNACPLAPGFKPLEHSQFVANAKEVSVVINKDEQGFHVEMPTPNKFEPKYDIRISALSNIVEVLKDSAESNRQKVVPLSQMFEDSDKQARSAKGIPMAEEVLDIPIGARGGDIQNILLKTTGDGSAHAVVIGGTGSGKSNLLHTIILNACYKYSPEELNLYLVDFKGGVEFKYYEANKVRERQIPHIKLTGLTSDPEDGVAILSNLRKELGRREDLFRQNGVEDIVQYRNLGKKIPRLFVIIDEIQELFEQDEKLGQKAIEILRMLFQKGRALGINILWASQNIPHVPGLRDKVLAQIGNRISLRLNEPDDAIDIKIDPKAVKNLNRPEKGLGVINDIRFGNDSIEFRVAYAETSENRKKYTQAIIDKWSDVTARTAQEPLFIVGDDDEPSAVDGNTYYNIVPTAESVKSKAFDSYLLQLGQDYVTGKPYDIKIPLREEHTNMVLVGQDVEVLRDIMGYSLLSVLMNHATNADCKKEQSKIYYANGEMINPKNSLDLFNVLKNDFGSVIENISSTDRFIKCIKEVYKLYRQRKEDSNSYETAKSYTPCFVIVHSMQRYADMFEENPMLKLKEEEPQLVQEDTSNQSVDQRINQAFAGISFSSRSISSNRNKSTDESVFLSDAINELLERGGRFGVHFIVSIDNPLGIQALKNGLSNSKYKIFTKGTNANVIAQMLGDYKAANALGNHKVALVSVLDERSKIRVYRYDDVQDQVWYNELKSKYEPFVGELL